jgi:GT2 family glycosyltransferase
MSFRTAVVILNWNNRNFLQQFLPDVIKYTSDQAELIVVDNASTDDSISILENNFPGIRIIRNIENKGYAGGYNAALSEVDTEYIVLLNSDVSVTENWLNPLIQLMDENKNAGACQPKILSYTDADTFEYAGGAGGFIDRFG